MATKIPAAQNRMFRNTFVCKNCNHKVKVDQLKILSGKVKCRKCGRHDFRVIKKK
jgi:Zn finger protein HypA/HybF involved in hydrogenase expression